MLIFASLFILALCVNASNLKLTNSLGCGRNIRLYHLLRFLDSITTQLEDSHGGGVSFVVDGIREAFMKECYFMSKRYQDMLAEEGWTLPPPINHHRNELECATMPDDKVLLNKGDEAINASDEVHPDVVDEEGFSVRIYGRITD